MEFYSSVDYSNASIYQTRKLLDFTLDVTFGIGLILNLLLFFICLRIKEKEFVSYKTIIILAVVTDLIFLFSTLGSINLLEPFNHNLVLFFSLSKYLINISDELALIISMFDMFIFMTSHGNNLLIFYYRYCILVNLLKLGYLIVLNMLWNGMNTIIWSLGTTSKGSSNNNVIEKELPIAYFYRNDGFAMKYFPLNIFSLFGMLAIIHVIITTSVVLIGESWMFLQIWRQLKVNIMIMSSKTKQIQSQLNLLMVFNAITAIFSSFFPCSLLVMCAIFGVNLYGMGNYCYVLFVWVTLLNPIASIIFIKPCREEIKKIFKFGKMHDKTITVVRTVHVKTKSII
uniref:G_PROTEIN_RECEP_F1_2 domain-containing protein n=1 Tax=Rhabditophanes sp. KR3021 TaxID=114890 RepID=A0AC35UDS9_9BILA